MYSAHMPRSFTRLEFAFPEKTCCLTVDCEPIPDDHKREPSSLMVWGFRSNHKCEDDISQNIEAQAVQRLIFLQYVVFREGHTTNVWASMSSRESSRRCQPEVYHFSSGMQVTCHSQKRHLGQGGCSLPSKDEKACIALVLSFELNILQTMSISFHAIMANKCFTYELVCTTGGDWTRLLLGLILHISRTHV